MKTFLCAAVSVALAILSSALYSADSKPNMFRVLVGESACYASVYSKRQVLIPSHCLKRPFEKISIEGIGLYAIRDVKDLSDIQGVKISERMVVVTFYENLFGGEKIRLTPARIGVIDTLPGADIPRCSIVNIQKENGYFYYSCPSWSGMSGRYISQNGHPVGFHLGKIRSKGLAIAAMGDGPKFDLPDFYGADFEPEKLSISCCKKLNKAVAQLGSNIEDGISSIADIPKNIAAEVGRLESDIRQLPKVFSVEYVQSKIATLKAPTFREFKMQSFELPQGDLDPFGNSPTWIREIVRGGTNVLKNTGNSIRDIVTLVPYTLWEIITHLSPPNLCSGCAEPPPLDICAENSSKSEKKACLDSLEKDIQAIKQAKSEEIRKLQKWIEQQKNKVSSP